MKRIIPFMMLMMAATPLAARADITSRMTSSVQLQVNAAATSMKRMGNSYSISGNNVDTTDGTTATQLVLVLLVVVSMVQELFLLPKTIQASHLVLQLHSLKVMQLIQLVLL